MATTKSFRSLVVFIIATGRSVAMVLGFAAQRGRKSGGGVGFGRKKKLPPDKPSTHYIADKSPNIQAFKSFLVSIEECEGIEMTTIGFDPQYGRRGVYCSESGFSTGEYICAIPFVSTLLVNEVYEPIIEVSSRDATSFEVESLSASRLENGLLFWKKFLNDEEQRERFELYFDCIPKAENAADFDPTPDFWTEDEIRQLEMNPLVDDMLARKQKLKELAESNNVPLDELQYAAWLVQTRAFTTFRKVPDPDNPTRRLLRTRTCIIPYVDFCNHSNDPNAELAVVETKEYVESFYALQATRDIAPGDEICICYGTGQETSLDLFAKYGFLPLRNENDRQLLGALETSFTTSLEQDEKTLDKIGIDQDSTPARILKARIHVKRLLAKKEAKDKQ